MDEKKSRTTHGRQTQDCSSSVATLEHALQCAMPAEPLPMWAVATALPHGER